MARFEVLENIDGQRVVGTKDMQEQLQQDLQEDMSAIVLPAFRTQIAQALGRTRDAHKFYNTGSLRSPMASGGGRNREARGSRTEDNAYVEVGRQFLRGERGRFTGGGASFDLSVGSTALTDDGSDYTLNYMVYGRTGAGTLRRRVKFWGRYGQEGPVTVTRFRHVSIPGKPEIIDDLISGPMLRDITERFRGHVQNWLAKDKLKGFQTKVRAHIDV